MKAIVLHHQIHGQAGEHEPAIVNVITYTEKIALTKDQQRVLTIANKNVEMLMRMEL